MDARKITKKQIEEWLRLGEELSPVYTDAAVTDGGWHHWWIDNENRVHCYGSGPGWCDQDSEVRNNEDIEYFLRKLYRYRKEIARNIEERKPY